MQNSICRQKLQQRIANQDGVSVQSLDELTPLDLIKKSLSHDFGYLTDATIKHIAFVVLASFNLAKANELLKD